jgi:hypothetical protein
MIRETTAVALFFLFSLIITPATSLVAQGEIQVEGVPVVTTETDQDTTYSAGEGLSLDGQVFKSNLAGQICPQGSALVGFDSLGDILCDCFPDYSFCTDECVDLQANPDHCGSCGVVCTSPDICSSGTCEQCDPAVQNCPDVAEACYTNITNSTKFCSAPTATAGQGEACSAYDSCSPGYGCAVLNAAQDSLLCVRFCDPDDLSGPAGDARCSSEISPDHSCVRATEYWGDLEPSMDNVGFCLDSGQMAIRSSTTSDMSW